MARSKIKPVPFRRKREGKTDYKKRLRLLMARKPRLVIRRSLKCTWLQAVEYSPAGDKILVSAHSSELKKLGWTASCSNLPASYLTGLLLGKKASEKKIKECILDLGLQASIKGGRLYAALKGAIDAGLNIPFSEDVLPKEERIKGTHIKEFNANQFEEVKKKIMGK